MHSLGSNIIKVIIIPFSKCLITLPIITYYTITICSIFTSNIFIHQFTTFEYF